MERGWGKNKGKGLLGQGGPGKIDRAWEMRFDGGGGGNRVFFLEGGGCKKML